MTAFTENRVELSTVIHSLQRACGQLGRTRPHRLSFQKCRPGRVSRQIFRCSALPEAKLACQEGADIHRLPPFVHNIYITAGVGRKSGFYDGKRQLWEAMHGRPNNAARLRFALPARCRPSQSLSDLHAGRAADFAVTNQKSVSVMNNHMLNIQVIATGTNSA